MQHDKNDARVSRSSGTSVEKVIRILQGAFPEPAIPRLGEAQAISLHRHASRQADLCGERARLLIDLMQLWINQDIPPLSSRILSCAGQIAILLHERAYWAGLAGQADRAEAVPPG